MSGLPKGWAETVIGDIAEVKGGKRLPKGHSLLSDPSCHPYVRVTDFNNGTVDIRGVKYLTEETYTSIKNYTISKNDLYISIAGTIGLVGEIPPGLDGANLTENAAKICNLNGVIKGYLAHVLKSPIAKKQFEDKISSSGQPKLALFRIKDSVFPLPPLNEQTRIANKLDSLLAKVDAAQTHLERIPTLLKRFRQSVLAAATSGELTREWRGQDTIDWEFIALKNVAEGFSYGSSAKSKNEGDVPVLRMGNLQDGKLDWEKLVYTSDKDEIEKYLLDPGDVLFNRTNSPELVGKTSIYRGERKAIYAGYLIKIKGTEKLNSEYLNIQLNSPHAREYCWQVKTDGVSQSNINAKKIGAYEFDLPPVSEQVEIVRRVEFLFAMADTVEKQYQQAKQRIDRLTQSILAKAFKGELVPQDPNDEPASELLKRIQAERESQKPAKKTRKQKGAA